jgi:hypothetical protein
MFGRLKRLRAAAVVTAALVGGGVYAAPSAAAALPPEFTETSTGTAAYPCGLSGEMRAHPQPGWNWYHYRIRNCHSYAVRRRVDVTNTASRDGPCIRIPGRGIVFAARMEINTQFDAVIGLRRC